MSAGEPHTQDKNAWAQLKRQVIDANNDVQDVLDVAALIESLGWTDQRVAATFGYANVFECGEQLYNEILADVSAHPVPPVIRVDWWSLAKRVLREFGHGITFTLPMFVSVAAMITLHLSFSGYADFPLTIATAIALGTFLSFFATGGFSQAMTHVYYVLLGLQKMDEVELTVFRVLLWGLLSTAGLGGLLILIDLFFPLMPVNTVILMVFYMIMLAGLWLSFSGLYILRREYLLAFTTALAIAVTYGLFTRHVPMIAAQAAGMLTGSVTTGALAWGVFRITVKRQKKTQSVIMTRLPQLLHRSAPYFLYGILYFTFVYVDRLVAWSSQTSYLPYNIWFRGKYELGMDWALAALILPLSATEVFIGHIGRFIERAEHRMRQRELSDFRQHLRRMYWRLLGIFGTLAAGGLVVVHFLILVLAKVPVLASSVPVVAEESTVFFIAGTAYVFLAVALFNILMLFTWSFPQPALRTLVYGLLVNAAVGVFATRLGGVYWYAVFGLITGSVFMAVFSVRQVLRVLPDVDYLLYRLT